MNGIFAMWQPRYAEKGIATFPVAETKKPCVRGWHKAGLKYSAVLASKFLNADALGYVTGRRSNITILDIDTTDEKIAEDAIRRHGQPIIVTRTASGKRHLLYRYNGERRRIRPWPDLPIDLLGDNGFALAAPSKLAAGSYEIIHGHFDDLANLKPMVGAPSEAMSLPPKRLGMREGDGRNTALWEHCMRTGAGCSLEQMMEIACNANQQFKEPMMPAEVARVADSAWRHDAAGLNFFTQPRVMIHHDIIDALAANNSDALLLLIKLERYNGGNRRFVLANAMAGSMGWGLPRWQRARDYLVKARLVRCIHPGGHGPTDPPIYSWAEKSLRVTDWS